MNRHLQKEHLHEAIRKFASESREGQQVARRLRTLLGDRLTAAKKLTGRRGASAERRALADAAYQEAIRDYAELLQSCLEAKVQFETHLMLLAVKSARR